MTQLWPAPFHPEPFTSTVVVPGSKSITNRAYVLAALASEPSTLVGALRSRDTDLMQGALEAMGADLDLRDGKAIGAAELPLPLYAVRERDGIVEISKAR